MSKLAVCDAETLRIYRKLEMCAMLNKLPWEIDKGKAVDNELLLAYLSAKRERDIAEMEMKKSA